ncbi:tetratricopeptide repeat-containing sulfotransferase family protein [Brevundimonas goettingensis]|uniref:Sulfotransferase n=1 Tax=Brevundimonas goettingensis TaxID=2774190 RepID=A0A975C0D1_9CAUL|nr:sulfotransferase [Brevundimonas goettingensis]QTC91488.1 sulfotransferase [Brevundimonas goettingensis]
MSVEAETLLRQAQSHKAAGRPAEAAEAYGALLALRPNMPDTWFNLAMMQRQAGRPAAALGAYQEALDRRISGPEEVHLNRAVIYSDDLGQADAAEAELKTALAIQPAYLAAWLNLGNLYEDKGERDQARSAYRRALDLAPPQAAPLALARLANATRFTDAADPLIEAMGLLLAQAGASDASRAEVGYALGRALDEVQSYDQAFAAYAEANAASRRATGATYDRAAQEAFVDRSIATFPKPVPTVWDPTGAPVFILGMFRSGSTLVERILAAHDGVTSGGELALTPRIVSAIAPYPEAAGEASPATAAGWRKSYLDQLHAARPGAALVTDKRPDNFLHIGLIKTMFPDAKIIHTVRQPLDMILSNWFLHLDASMAYAMDLEDAAHWYGQHERLMAHWKSLYPDILTVDYDALVADPRPEIERVLTYCGLDWQDQVMEFHKAGGAVRTASVWQIREPLYRKSSGRWRNYESHLGGLRGLLGE